VYLAGMLFSEKFTGTLESALDPILSLGGSLVSVMHTESEHVAAALAVVKRHWSGPLGAYGHSGRFVMPQWQFNDVISPEDYLKEADKWVSMGVQVIGGCCGIGPAHIQLLKERLPTQIPQ
jgi:S-methylmethionine-dependent homocysteine/selenocysteine methylase